MTLQEKLRDIKRTSTLIKLNEYPVVEKAKNFEELWEKVIKPNLPDKSAVQQWHKILMAYVRQDDAVLSLRAYGSPSGNSPALRRGFLNKVFVNDTESFETFFVDNFFTAFFFSMAKDGYAPKNLDEFKKCMDNREFPCGCIQTTDERALAAYFKGTNPEISGKGYKIAHIFSAGENYDPIVGYHSIGNFCDIEFPRGSRSEWSHINAHGHYYRRIDFNDSYEAEKVKKFAVAHFLRTVHPINYFLVPNKPGRYDEGTNILKTNIYWNESGVEKDEIGEYPKLVEYVAAKIKDIYKDVFGDSGKSIYQEFLDLIYPAGNCIDPKEVNVTIDAEYAIGLWQKNAGTVSIPIIKTKTKTSTSRTRSAYTIELVPSDKDLFKRELLIKKQAKRTITYKDGSIKKEVWDASSFSTTSDLGGNVSSQIWHRNDKDQIVKVVFEV